MLHFYALGGSPWSTSTVTSMSNAHLELYLKYKLLLPISTYFGYILFITDIFDTVEELPWHTSHMTSMCNADSESYLKYEHLLPISTYFGYIVFISNILIICL